MSPPTSPSDFRPIAAGATTDLVDLRAEPSGGCTALLVVTDVDGTRYSLVRGPDDDRWILTNRLLEELPSELVVGRRLTDAENIGAEDAVARWLSPACPATRPNQGATVNPSDPFAFITWDTGIAARQGGRAHQCDAVATDTSEIGRWSAAVVDGIGDHEQTGRIARFLATSIAKHALRRTPDLALRATADDYQQDVAPDGHDAVAVALAISPGEPDVDVAWVGDCAVYWTDTEGELHLTTTEHTLAGDAAARGMPAAPGDEHVVTRTVLGIVSTKDEPDVAKIPLGRVRRILMCTDGVSKAVEEPAVLAALRLPTAQDAAQALVDAAILGRDGAADLPYADNATALVVEIIHSH